MKIKTLILTLLLSFSFFNAHAQDADKIRLLTQESMVNVSDGINLQLAWYLADPFWEYVINANPETANTDMGDEFYEMVTEYNIVAVVMGRQSYGRFYFSSEDEMRKTMLLKGQDGKSYKPIDESDLSDDMNLMLDIFRPILGQLLGDMGANFHFFVFEKENNKGDLIFDPTKEEDVTIETMGASLTWKLPMSALIPEKRCPKDDELMNGTWNYCPIHGNKLVGQ